MKKHIFIFLFLFFVSNTSQALCVKDFKANLRSGPGTNFEKTWLVYQYMPFKIIKKQKDWYQVEDLDGDQHWVTQKLVSENLKCAVTLHDETIIRTGPGDNFDETEFSPEGKYYSLKVLQIKDGWVKVEDMDRDVSWIQEKDLWIQ